MHRRLSNLFLTLIKKRTFRSKCSCLYKHWTFCWYIMFSYFAETPSMVACYLALHTMDHQELNTWLLKMEGLFLNIFAKFWISPLCEYSYIFVHLLGHFSWVSIAILSKPDVKGLLQISFILVRYIMPLFVQNLLPLQLQRKLICTNNIQIQQFWVREYQSKEKPWGKHKKRLE